MNVYQLGELKKKKYTIIWLKYYKDLNLKYKIYMLIYW